MKRAMLSMAAALAAGCSPNPPESARDGVEAAREWARPPVIERVDRTGPALVVSGLAAPDARVVLRGADDTAFAAAADSRGRFEVRVPAPAGHLLLRPETQAGQDSAPSPDRLLILESGRGPIVMLRTGGATRRLDAAPALGAVDGDGRMRLASGAVSPGTAAVEVQSGGETLRVVPDAGGRWSVILPPRDGPESIRVAGREFLWPGEAGGSSGLVAERTDAGWRVRWTGPGGARQTTWLPDRVPS